MESLVKFYAQKPVVSCMNRRWWLNICSSSASIKNFTKCLPSYPVIIYIIVELSLISMHNSPLVVGYYHLFTWIETTLIRNVAPSCSTGLLECREVVHVRVGTYFCVWVLPYKSLPSTISFHVTVDLYLLCCKIIAFTDSYIVCMCLCVLCPVHFTALRQDNGQLTHLWWTVYMNQY